MTKKGMVSIPRGRALLAAAGKEDLFRLPVVVFRYVFDHTQEITS
jgi:hypothetical protein